MEYKISNSAIIYGFLGRIISSGGYLFTSILVATILSPVEQGYFYVLLSLCASYYIIDLGMTTAVIQAISHEFSCDDSKTNFDNIKIIINKVLRWFIYGMIIFIFGAILFGKIYFWGQIDSYLIWPIGWVISVFVISIEIFLLSFMGVIEASNRVISIYRYRAIKTALFTLSVSAMLIFDIGLLSLPLGYVFTWPLSWYFICIENKNILRYYKFSKIDLKSNKSLSEFNKFQTGLAISTLAGFLATWAIVPLAVKVLGPVVGGKIGLVWSFGFGVSAMASVPINVGQSTIARLAAKGDRRGLEKFVIKVGSTSIVLCLLGVISVLFFIYIANINHWPISKRLLGYGEASLLLLGIFLTHITLPISAYLRAHKIEPLMYVSVFFSFAMLVFTYIASKIYGEIGFLAGYPITASLIAVPWILIIFLRFRERTYF